MSSPVRSLHSAPGARSDPRAGLIGLLKTTTPWRWFARCSAAHRDAQALRNLTPHLLEDIGMTRAQADAEADRLIWDPPAHWNSLGHSKDSRK